MIKLKQSGILVRGVMDGAQGCRSRKTVQTQKKLGAYALQEIERIIQAFGDRARPRRARRA